MAGVGVPRSAAAAFPFVGAGIGRAAVPAPRGSADRDTLVPVPAIDALLRGT